MIKRVLVVVIGIVALAIIYMLELLAGDWWRLVSLFLMGLGCGIWLDKLAMRIDANRITNDGG